MVEQGKIRAADLLSTFESTVRSHRETVTDFRTGADLAVILTDGIPISLIGISRHHANQYTFLITRARGLLTVNKRQLKKPDKMFDLATGDSPDKFGTLGVGVHKKFPDVIIGTDTLISLVGSQHNIEENKVTFRIETTRPITVAIVPNKLSGEGLGKKMADLLDGLEKRILAKKQAE